MCTKNHNHMRYGSWDTKWDRQIFFLSFWAIFFPFTPKTTHKIKILKKWKKHLGMSTSYTYVQQITIKWCMLSETWSTTDRFFVTLDYFLPFYPPNNPENHNFEKLKKMPGDIIILHIYTINENHVMYVPEIRSATVRQNFLSVWVIFCPLTPLTTLKIKIWKKI